MDKKDGGTIDLESLRGFTPGPHPDAQPTPDECFCDRMYPDSNPNASCGDCPTRDYAPKPPSIPEPSEADVELAWSTLRSTTQPRDSCACDGDMRAVLSGFAARLRERVGQAPGGDGDA